MAEPHSLQPSDPCPCGSEICFQDCCIATGRAYYPTELDVPVVIRDSLPQQYREHLRRMTSRQSQFGKVRPVISTEFEDLTLVTIDNEILFSNTWRTFPDFLVDYLRHILGTEWWTEQVAIVSCERHQIACWYDGVLKQQSTGTIVGDRTLSVVADGQTLAFMLLAYDIYVLRNQRALQAAVVHRLKNRDQFQGARYELFVAATCIRAGFELDFENEADGSRRHSEFLATHRESGESFFVEAKSRHRNGILGRDGESTVDEAASARIGGLLNDAIDKNIAGPLVIFIDVNLPATAEPSFEKRWFRDVEKSVSRINGGLADRTDPFNLLVFTNHPFHYDLPGQPASEIETISVFGTNPCYPINSSNLLTAIHEAAMKFDHVPKTFDGAS